MKELSLFWQIKRDALLLAHTPIDRSRSSTSSTTSSTIADSYTVLNQGINGLLTQPKTIDDERDPTR
ncbi:hypothetical protein [Egbenema bharatensis]|uniref:hypothetical protein n=1 Tax=Egbenema bharatensis TaxID=3463334 RepID=UPI003A871186